jgi:hypothetical protein
MIHVVQTADGCKAPVLVCQKGKQKRLTENDKATLAEWVEYCRERAAKEQRKRNARLAK